MKRRERVGKNWKDRKGYCYREQLKSQRETRWEVRGYVKVVATSLDRKLIKLFA